MHSQTLAFFGDKVSLCSADQPGPFPIARVDFEFTEICLSLLGSKVCILASGQTRILMLFGGREETWVMVAHTFTACTQEAETGKSL